MLDEGLLFALDDADGGNDEIGLWREPAEQLLALDVEAHGYGPKRALRSDRDNCEHCAEIGRALEALLPHKLRKRS